MTVMISVSSAILTAAGRPGWAMLAALPIAPLALVGPSARHSAIRRAGATVVTLVVAAIGAALALVAVHRAWGVWPSGSTGRQDTRGHRAYRAARRMVANEWGNRGRGARGHVDRSRRGAHRVRRADTAGAPARLVRPASISGAFHELDAPIVLTTLRRVVLVSRLRVAVALGR